MRKGCQRTCHYVPRIMNMTFRRLVCKKDAGDILENDVTFTAAIRFVIRLGFVSPRGDFYSQDDF